LGRTEVGGCVRGRNAFTVLLLVCHIQWHITWLSVGGPQAHQNALILMAASGQRVLVMLIACHYFLFTIVS
jgi:hypothetical protein